MDGTAGNRTDKGRRRDLERDRGKIREVGKTETLTGTDIHREK